MTKPTTDPQRSSILPNDPFELDQPLTQGESDMSPISTVPQTQPILTDDGVPIRGIGTTLWDATAIVRGQIVTIPAGTRIATSGSAGYDNRQNMSVIRRRRLSDGAELLFAAGKASSTKRSQ